MVSGSEPEDLGLPYQEKGAPQGRTGIFMISFNDIFKNSFLENGTFGDMSPLQIALSLAVALLCSMMIFLFYKYFFRGVVYNHNFNVLLVMVTLVTSFIIMTISSNIVLSLGMVGALSIVRFRAAVKDPLDVGFLFWAVAAGITAGAGLYLFAITSTLVICIVFAVFSSLKSKKNVYLVIINYDEAAKEQVLELLDHIKYTLRNKTCRGQNTELTIEIKAKQENTSITENFSRIESVHFATMVQYNGDFEG